ncbi:B3 domain-containing protein Os01g0723500 isoform X2 [Cryptomeria japonica]|uniref:B3 domain-containing protein Os01g0723500 isoform X2 n=1 Tax=Cryptomeria japonica TaxID=3369 RepID=UPI0027D9EA1E|nr:B3 domain-containing protein Os01g0723500 isoform X2 [Cryptomeria japonica]
MAVMKNIKSFQEAHRKFEACLECTKKCLSIHSERNNNSGNNGDDDDLTTPPSHFFKVLLGDFANVLRIPPAFVERFQWHGLQNAFLIGPSGQIWIVTVCCTSTGMTFEKGWQTFVSDHSLDLGDFLVFKYVGESYFTVKIFGRSGCEKWDAFNVRKYEPCSMNGGKKVLQKSREGSAGISKGLADKTCIVHQNTRNGDCEVCKLPISATFIKSSTAQIDNSRKRKRCTNSKDSVSLEEDIIKLETAPSVDQGKKAGNSLGKAVILDAERESVEALTKNNLKKYVVGARSCQSHVPNQDNRLCGVKKTKITSLKIQTPNDEGKKYVSAHYVSCRREVTQEEREKALKDARSFQSDKPFNLIVMKQSQVYQGFWLGLSRDFTKRWLPDQRIEITLLGPRGKKWRVQYLGDRSNPGLSGGWKGFAIDNNLEEGDVCVFELEDKKNFTLKVHIYRVVEDCIPPKKVEGTKRKNEESEKNSVSSTREKKSSKPIPKLDIKTESHGVKANNGTPAITRDVFLKVPKVEM